MPDTKPRNVGDRVSFAASPSADCRTVYTGTIQKIEDEIAYVIVDGYLHSSGVATYKLHDEGAYKITSTGPRGIHWTDRGPFAAAFRSF
jgi:hypothetical protein